MPIADQPNDEQSMELVQRIGNLFFRKLRGDLNEQEQQVLNAWLAEQSPESRRFFEEMQDWEEIRKALVFLYAVDRPAALIEVQKKIQSQRPDEEPVRTTGRPWLRWAAAAAVVLAIGGVWLVRGRHKDIAALPAEERFRHDLTPGGQRATLQLSGGQRILLDSAADGVLTMEGSTRVVKQADGELAYNGRGGQKAGETIGYNSISTPRGGQYRVTLPDGSRVWLNATSVLRFPTRFTGAQRRVELSGEAYFEVEKNPAMPFVVAVSSQPGAGPAEEVRVLGTRFDIEAYADENAIRTTLVDGSVKVKAGRDSLLLTPGRQASAADNGAGHLILSAADTNQVLAWKNGLFQFRNTPLETVMRQVSRWYDVDIVYEGKVNQSFTGKIPRSVPASTLLKILESTGTAHFTIGDKKVTVAP